MRHRSAVSLVLAALLLCITLARAEDVTRALPVGVKPDDARLGPLRNLDGYFPFTPVDSPDAWAKRAAELRRQTLVANGLWPLPTRTPLNAVVHGKIDREEYTVEKVILESFPGHYVTGSLYRPKGLAPGAKAPVFLTPHGHWNNGRFHDQGEAGVRQEIANGAERFEQAGRYHLQSIAVQLARMGCLVLFYDMVGYADSFQLAHRAGVRANMNGSAPGTWGLFSAQAELRLQNPMGLQTWNSIRALDFMLSLPEADPTRVGVTGASGGGTQSFILSAVDDRVTLSVPAVMVSTSMQGGCTCENASYLRTGAGNIDLAALTAPRPLGMLAANDWTKEMATKGFPDLQNLYKMLGVPDHVALGAFVHFGHNYNAVSRVWMSNFVNKHFKLGHKEPVIERDHVPVPPAELSVWDASHPRPTGDQVGDVYEMKLMDVWAKDSEKRIAEVSAQPEEFRRVVGGGWAAIIGRDLEQVGPIAYDKPYQKFDRGDYVMMTAVLGVTKHHEQVPALFLHPKNPEWNKRVVVWVTDTGKAELLDSAGQPIPQVAALLKKGFVVAGLDLFGQGEFTDDGKPLAASPVSPYGAGNEAWMKSAVYTFGYNRPLFCRRVHDVLSMIRFVQTNDHGAQKIDLVGVGTMAGPIAMAAKLQAGNVVAKAMFDNGPKPFVFASVTRFDDPMFVPGAVKYGDVQALQKLSAPAVGTAKPASLADWFLAD